MEDYILSKGPRIWLGMGWGKSTQKISNIFMEVLYLVKAGDFLVSKFQT